MVNSKEILEQLLDKYISNQVTLNELKGMYLQPVESEKQIIKIISDLSMKQRDIFFENEDILNRTVLFYKKNVHLIDDDIYAIFKNFALRINTTTVQIDAPIAYEVSEFLLKYAQNKNDLNLIIEESYYCGVILNNIDKKIFRKELSEFFNITKTYESDYFKLSKRAREHFNRSYGNRLIAFNANNVDYRGSIALAKEIIAFWDRPEIRNLDPDFDFETYKFVIKRNTLVFLDVIRTKGNLDFDIMETLYQFSKDVYLIRQRATQTLVPTVFNYTYAYFAMSYHTSRISIDELLNVLEDISKPLPDAPYSLESRARVIRGGTYAALYYDYTSLPKEVIYQKKIDKYKNVIEYIKKMPISIYERLLQNEIVTYIKSFTRTINEEDVFELIMELTIYRHLPTYIHITMVSKIATTILKYAIEVMPSYFVGMLGLESVEDVIKSKGKLFDIIEKSSLLHDVGKFFCLEYVSNYGRKLTDIEFRVIKNHPSIGYEVLLGSQIPNIYAEATLFHHLWHDLNGGYPLEFQEEVKNIKTNKLIQIITLADSIDAATDYLGRPYARRKTLNELKVEFSEGAGSRYSPELVDLLRDPSLGEELEQLITKERVKVTINAYKLFQERRIKNK